MMPRLYPSLCLAMLACVFSSSHAARPMATDDARIVDTGSCQLESWYKHTPDHSEFWALPGCNLTGNLEVTFGGMREYEDGTSRHSDTLLQVKTLLRPLAPNDWGAGLALGTVRHPADPSRNAFGDVYGYVPLSAAFGGERFVLHLNAGFQHLHNERRTAATWGLGSETQLHPSTFLIAEAYGQHSGKPFVQLGIRQWLVKDRVQIDATYGNQPGFRSESRWLTIGLRLLSPSFLP